MKLGCILLAAGSGKRFGGDKLRCEIDGISMIERACILHAAVHYDERILVSRPEDYFVAFVANKYGFRLVINEHAMDGIGTSAAAGINALLGKNASYDGALFAVCDQPYLKRSTVETLIAAFQDDKERIIAPECQGKRGNPVVFPAALLPEFTLLDSDAGGSAIIRNHSAQLSTVTVSDPSELFDIDTRLDETRLTHGYNHQR